MGIGHIQSLVGKIEKELFFIVSSIMGIQCMMVVII